MRRLTLRLAILLVCALACARVDQAQAQIISGVLPTPVTVPQGGTGATTLTANGVLYGNATGPIQATAVCGAGSYLRGTGGAPVCSNDLAVATATLSTPKLTPGAGTGITVNDPGSVRTQVYKVSLAKEAFAAAAVTNNTVIATMPVGTILHSVVARVTQAFVCAAVCTTATLSATLGIAPGGTEFLVSFDLDAAIATFGDANAEMGSALSIAGQFNSGYVSSFTQAEPVTLQATSGTGNWGDGVNTNLSAGAVTFYLLATVLP